MKRVGVLCLSILLTVAMHARSADTTVVRKQTWMGRLLDYLSRSNEPNQRKSFDFSIIGGPHYSSDVKLGVGLVGVGVYRTDPADSLMPPSNVSLYSDVTTAGFYMAGVRGTHIFPHQRCRLEYNAYFYSFAGKFWGIGYEMGNVDANESKMRRMESDLNIDVLMLTAPHLYVGPSFSFKYAVAKDLRNPALLQGENPHSGSAGAGATVLYDTRDVMTNAHRGCYLSATSCVKRNFKREDWFLTTKFNLNGYFPAWKGATIATQVDGVLQLGNLTWSDLAMLGGSNTMRGYYEGRYRDRNKLEGQVELRQFVKGRSGVVAWFGAGTVFSQFSELRMRKLLPSFGLGYRWEFKKNMNVRLDFGFGKGGQSGFVFDINEAF